VTLASAYEMMNLSR